MKRFAWGLVLVLSACPPTPEPEPEDAGEELPVPYDGPAVPSGVPDFLPPFDAGDGLIDSGVIMVDPTCCETRFSISDVEPTQVSSALLRIPLAKFGAGVTLSRDGGRWHGSGCFPVNTSAAYFYEFTFDGGLVDGGSRALDDGGYEFFEVSSEVVSQRASDEEPSFIDADGLPFNFYRAVSTCDGLDGSVPGP